MHVGDAVVAGLDRGGGIEADAIVGHDERRSASLAVERHHKMPRARMARRVAEGLAGEMEELCTVFRREVPSGSGIDVDIDLDEGVVAELLDERDDPGGDVGAVERLRAKAVDEGAQLANRRRERIDGCIDPALSLTGSLRHHFRDVLERERNRVQRLNDPVVEIATDPIALLDDGEVGRLLVQPGIVDRDAGVERKQLDKPLIVGRELRRARLVGQIEVAD